MRPVPTVVRRAAATTGVLGAVAAAYLVGTAGPAASPGPRTGGGGEDAPWAGTSPIAYAGSGLAPAEDCADLRDWYVARGLERVGPHGWEPGIFAVAEELGMPVEDSLSGPGPAVAPQGVAPASVAGRATAPLSAAKSVRQTSDDTGTNVQEAGVDEPDVVKTDGSTLFRVEGGDLVTYDLTGSAVERLGAVDLPGLADAEILLAGTAVVAVGREPGPRHHPLAASVIRPEASTRVAVVDVADPAAPRVTHEATYDTQLLTARLHEGVVRLVVQAGLPDLPFVEPGRGRGVRAAERHNRQVVRDSALEDWLPTVAVDGGDPEQVLECTDVAVPDDAEALGTVAVVAFAADDPAGRVSTGLAVDTGVVYASTDQLYLATGAASTWDCCVLPGSGRGWLSDEGGATQLYAFDLDGLRTRFTASGEVDGAIDDRWSMDAVDGVLRVAVGPTHRTGNYSSVVTLRQEGNDLVEAGRLDELGVNERIQAVRWFDDLAIVVTFREVDPLYAVDLTDPAAPRLLGELKIPGFSGYLHPLGEHRMVGMGQGPAGRGGWGAQAGLFDVTDLTDVRRLDVHSYGPGTEANAMLDPRQLTWLPERRTVLTVVTRWDRSTTGYVSVLRLERGRFVERLVEVEHGAEVGQVRLVPLPDGRVVLVTGDGAEFFQV